MATPMNTDEDEKTRLTGFPSDLHVVCWAELLAHQVDRLSRFIALRLDRRLQSRVDAEDVIQEIYVEAWRHLPEYRRNSTLPFCLWVRGLARNKLFELHRQHLGTKMRDARRETAELRPHTRETALQTFASVSRDGGASPSIAVAREETRARLRNALETMGQMDREVLVLRHFEQLSLAETAQVLGIDDKAAGMRHVRALKRLRNILSALPGGLEEFLP
jgi:RNA polymerase sigma-70 factor (ECF subfamily)